jgi:SSS family solute:Na+ symporter
MLWIDIAIVALFFIIMIIVGFWDKKKITLEDYWVNGRNTNSFFLMATMFSTFIGVGAILGAAGLSFSSGGLIIIAVGLSYAFYMILFSKFFAPKVKEFGDKYKVYTLPDFFEIRYSNRVRIIGAIINLITYGMFTAVQILGMGIFVGALTGLNANLATVIGALVVIAYTSLGGLRADIRTDVFQFVIMLSLLFVFLPVIIFKAGISSITTLSYDFLIGTEFMSLPLVFVAFLFLGAGLFASAEIWQRVYSAKSEPVAKKGTFWAAIFVGLFGIMAVLFGTYGKVLLPGSTANTIVSDLLVSFVPTGLYGLILAGFFAAIMSSADTMILIFSMTLLRDIWRKPIDNFDHKKFLRLSRIVTFIVGILGLIVALLVFNIVHLAIESVSFYVVMVPSVVFGFYWKRANEKAAFWSILLGLITLIGLMSLNR